MTYSLTVPIFVRYTAEQALEVNELRLDTASSEGNTMAGAICAIKNRNILAPNMAPLSAAAGGSAYLNTFIVKEDIHSEGGYYVTADTWRNEQTSNA